MRRGNDPAAQGAETTAVDVDGSHVLWVGEASEKSQGLLVKIRKVIT